jgi:hypothetical protein
MKVSTSDSVNKLAAAILTISGLIALPIQVAEWLNSSFAGWVTGIGVGLLLISRAVRVIVPSKIQRRFGLKRYKSPPILASGVDLLQIDEDYRATIETTQTFIFTEEPSPEDLVDIIDVLPNRSVESISYSSSDSEIAAIVRKTPSTLAIRWRPRTPIVPFIPYEHRTTYDVPGMYGDDLFYQGLYIDRVTGQRYLEVVCWHRVDIVMAFVMPRIGARITEEYLARRMIGGEDRRCEQPVIESVESGATRIKWTLKNPELGRTYVLFAVYQGKRGVVSAKAMRGCLLSRVVKALTKAQGRTADCATSPSSPSEVQNPPGSNQGPAE